MQASPLVSIVTVVFNGAEAVEPTIVSVLGQSFTDREFIVIDGGSTDATMQIVRKYADGIDVAISERDRGIYDAMNKALGLARGKWVIFMNCGDTFADAEVLVKLAPMLRDDRYQVVAGAFLLRWSDLEMPFLPNPLKIGSMPSCHQAVLVRTEAAKRCGFDTTLRVGADYNMMCDILRKAPHGLGLSDVVVARVTAAGFSDNHKLTALRDYRRIVRRHFGAFSAALYYLRIGFAAALSAAIKSLLPGSVVRTIRRARYGRG